MIHREFDPFLPHPFVRYARMSSSRQNPLSPEQQFNTIDDVVALLGYPWVHVKDYRDDGRSGRLIAKRKGFQRMLTDIRAGIVKPDLILIDTFERLGRADEIAIIRRELEVEHGVLVLSADNRFSDPTSIPGKALASFEQMRATEEGRIKAHQVLRGKRSAAERGYWPGGPVPLGLKPESVLVTRNGAEEVDGRRLVPDPRTSWIIRALWDKADETGWGTTRLARWLNGRPDVPDKFRPFYPDSVGYMLDNRIYAGDLVWERNSTDIINDTRRVVPNPEEQVRVYPGFCEPLVPAELWDRVHTLRRKRSEAIKRARAAKHDDDGKKIAPLAPGITLKHPLSGLVRCGHCGRAMQPISSGARSKAGRTYSYYRCVGRHIRTCPNKKHVPEETLRAAVLAALRRRLFPPPEHEGDVPTWFGPLVHDVQHELDRTRDGDHDERPALHKELESIGKNNGGWSLTLANPKCPSTVRAEIEKHFDASIKRAAEIENRITEIEAAAALTKDAVDPEAVLDRLHRIADLLQNANPTALALELSRHIDRIECYAEGKVEMLTVKTGIFLGITELLSRSPDAGRGKVENALEAGDVKRINPRRRGKLRVVTTGSSPATATQAEDTGLDPARLAGLAGRFFWKDEPVTLERRCWAAEHALAVSRKLAETGWTQAGLARHFGKSRPTIRHALEMARNMRDGPADDTAPPDRQDPKAG